MCFWKYFKSNECSSDGLVGNPKGSILISNGEVDCKAEFPGRTVLFCIGLSVEVLAFQVVSDLAGVRGTKKLLGTLGTREERACYLLCCRAIWSSRTRRFAVLLAVKPCLIVRFGLNFFCELQKLRFWRIYIFIQVSWLFLIAKSICKLNSQSP